MRKGKLLKWSLALLTLVMATLYLSGIIPVMDERYRPSGQGAYVPDGNESFSAYIQENRRRIRSVLSAYYYDGEATPFGPEYPLERVVEMRAPFEIPPDNGRCDNSPDSSKRGFLLIHGLTDSPYLMSELAASLTDHYPCDRIRSLLMPGHGTLPGDLLEVKLEDWQAAVSYGMRSFGDLVDDLYLVGYSNGAALAIDYLQRHPEDKRIAGLILFSPGLASAQQGLATAGFLKYLVHWISRGPDRDPAKYDSMPTHAAAQFYRVTRRASSGGDSTINRPVFMAVSGEDATADSTYAADYFCNRVSSDRRVFLWYRSEATGNGPPQHCAGMEIIDVGVPRARVVSLSHVAISMPAENEHYGLNGNYAVCTAYIDDPSQFESCNLDDEATVYGENTLGDESGAYQGRLIRRASFNPLYREMIEELFCFIETSCTSRRVD